MARARRCSCRCRATSQAIMSVQLLSWCAAACLLLYRGVTTLRREPPPRPPPGFNFTWLYNGSASEYDPSGTLILPDNRGVSPNNELSATNNATISPNNELLPLYNSSSNGLPSLYEGLPSSNVIPSDNALVKNGSSRFAPRGVANASAPRVLVSAGAGAPGMGTGVPGAGVSSFARLRRELRPASLILIVLGFSMLLVGPVVVMMRKCDSTLSQRRASKLPTEEEACDPPPSYDEATRACAAGSGGGAESMSVAPRYSSLFLVQDSGELVLLNPPAAATAHCNSNTPCNPEATPGSAIDDDLAPVHCYVHKAEIMPTCRRT